MKRIILMSFLCAVICMVNSCGWFKRDKSEQDDKPVKEVKAKVVEQTPTLLVPEFNIDTWLEIQYKANNISELKSSLINESLNLFKMRLSEFVGDNTKFADNFLSKQDNYEEYVNSLRVGPVSMKSLEQIVNFEIQNYNGEHLNNPMKPILLKYMDIENAIAPQSIDNINIYYNILRASDMKKKQQKQEYYRFVTNEILRNYCIELSKQGFFSGL